MIDFHESESHYYEHLLPVWNALAKDVKGLFYHGAASLQDLDNDHILVCSVKDLQTVRGAGYRHIAFMEHGVGITYGSHSFYAGGRGSRTYVELFLAPNEIVQAKTLRALPGARSVVVGTPKLDSFQLSAISGASSAPLSTAAPLSTKKTVCVSFHWDGSGVAPEAGSAFNHFKGMLPLLNRWRGFKVIGHGHPRAMKRLRVEYEKLGIEVVTDFAEVMQRADVYVCDNSSTIYEFCVTGKPVVLLNAPQYRKDVQWGIRFWDYTDVGPCIDDPNELLGACLHALECDDWDETREKAVRELYPFLGESAGRAAEVLTKWMNGEWFDG